MEKSANQLADKAETTRQVALIAQSNSLRRTAANIKEQLATTEKNLDELLKQMKEN